MTKDQKWYCEKNSCKLFIFTNIVQQSMNCNETIYHKDSYDKTVN